MSRQPIDHYDQSKCHNPHHLVVCPNHMYDDFLSWWISWHSWNTRKLHLNLVTGFFLFLGFGTWEAQPYLHLGLARESWQNCRLEKTRDSIIPGIACLDWVAILPVWRLTCPEMGCSSMDIQKQYAFDIASPNSNWYIHVMMYLAHQGSIVMLWIHECNHKCTTMTLAMRYK